MSGVSYFPYTPHFAQPAEDDETASYLPYSPAFSSKGEEVSYLPHNPAFPPPSGQVVGYTYFVDPAGSDAADGKTEATAWKTIAKVNAAALTSGQSVAFKRGGVWRETLTPPQSGVAFGDYGTGALPTISAANLKTWTQGTGQAAAETGGVFASGMETTSLSDWTVHATDIPVAQSTTHAAHGTYSVAIGPGVATGNRGYLTHVFTPAIDTTYYFRFYIYYPSGSLIAGQQVKFFGLPIGGPFVHLDVNGSGVITAATWYDSTHSAQLASGAITFPPDTWNFIEMSYRYSATVGGGQMWVNGTSVGSNFTVNTSSLAGVSTQMSIGLTGFASDVTVGAYVYLDDFKMDTAGPIGQFSGGGLPTTVWTTPQATNPFVPIFGSSFGTKVASSGALTAANQYYWDGSATLYVYSATDPTSTVEVPTRSTAITVTGKSGITLRNLAWRGATANGLSATGQVSNMTVQGCTIELNWTDGWRLLENTATISNVLLNANEVRYNGSSGFNHNASFTQNCTITGNLIHHNGQVVDAGGDHTFIGGWKGFSQAFNTDTTASPCGTGFLIKDNIVHDNGRDSTGAAIAGQVSSVNGIWPDTMADVTVQNNTVYGNIGHGVFLEKNFRSVAHHNLSYSNANASFTANLAMKCSDGNNANASKMYHNTSYGGWWGIYCGAYEGNGASNFSNVVVENNIAVAATSGTNMYIDVGGNNNGTNGSGNTYDHNCLGPAATNFVFWAPNNRSTYAAVDTDYGSAMLNVQADPLLNNPGSADFTLQAGSPCIGAGTYIAGISATNPPNVGAF